MTEKGIISFVRTFNPNDFEKVRVSEEKIQEVPIYPVGPRRCYCMQWGGSDR